MVLLSERPLTYKADRMPSKPLLFAPAPVLEKRPPRSAAALESAPALAKIWNGSRYLRVLGDAVKRALR